MLDYIAKFLTIICIIIIIFIMLLSIIALLIGSHIDKKYMLSIIKDERKEV